MLHLQPLVVIYLQIGRLRFLNRDLHLDFEVLQWSNSDTK